MKTLQEVERRIKEGERLSLREVPSAPTPEDFGKEEEDQDEEEEMMHPEEVKEEDHVPEPEEGEEGEDEAEAPGPPSFHLASYPPRSLSPY